MTAGRGVVHAEDGRATTAPTMHGVQLWIAQPEATRQGEAAFEHHAVLPDVAGEGHRGSVLVGTFAGATSPARTDTPLVGVDLVLLGDVELPVDPDHEHVLVVLIGRVQVGGRTLLADHSAYHAPGRSVLRVAAPEGARALLLGGQPLGEEILMWWNFVARSRDEVDEAARDWQRGDADRFGAVDTDLDRIDAPPTPWGG